MISPSKFCPEGGAEPAGEPFVRGVSGEECFDLFDGEMFGSRLNTGEGGRGIEIEPGNRLEKAKAVGGDIRLIAGRPGMGILFNGRGVSGCRVRGVVVCLDGDEGTGDEEDGGKAEGKFGVHGRGMSAEFTLG